MSRPALHAACALGAAVALIVHWEGVAAGAPPPGGTPPRHEAPDDPYLPPAGGAVAGGGEVVFGDYVSVQVNVEPPGKNVTGDAGNEPSIAVDPTAPNRMVIGWRQFDNVGSNFRQAGWAWSHDGGRTWTFPGVIQPGVFRSDPVLGADAAGTFYYCSLQGNFTVQFFRSLDAGLSWGPALPAFGGDKQWFTIDRTGSVGQGHIYMSWSTSAGCCGNDIFTRSVNQGTSFLTPLDVPENVIWGTLDVASDGTLFLGGIASSPFDAASIYAVRSSNARFAAQTPSFDLAELVDLGGTVVFGEAPNPGGLLGQVNVAVDRSAGPTAGNVYVLASVDPPGPDPLEVRFARSEDGGAGWSSPVTVNHDFASLAWQWFGTMSVAPGGRIDVVWNDTRNSGLDNVSQLFYASSSDGGATWSPNVAVSPPFDSHVGWPNQNKIGDYYHMVSDDVGASVAYAATFNGEQDVWFLRIGDRDCNSNGTGDAQDIEGGRSGDCDADGIPDECEIAAGTLPDENRNGIPDPCETCPWDLDGDGAVGMTDLLALLAAWGPAPRHPADFDGDGSVGVTDLLALLGHWGRCA